MYKANQPQFFKIILDNSLIKLGIPRKFVRNYGENLSNWVILKVPSGEKWQVDILKIDAQIWLEKGWQEFMEYYSIVIGSLLVFQYDESISGFNVTIFDRTCTEIDYPYRHSVNNEPRVPKVESEITRKRKENSLLPSSPPLKKMKEVENFANVTGTKGTSAENPVFEIAMYKSHVHPNSSNLVIPARFARRCMNSKKDGIALLNVLDRRTWSVKYFTKVTSGVTRTKLTHSCWKEFAQDNHLQVGDVLKFELIDPHKTLFRVVISRLGSRSSKRAMDKETNVILRNTLSSNFTSLKPNFQVVVKSWHLRGKGVHVPSNFIKKNLNHTTQDVKLLLHGKIWCVRLIVYPRYGRGKLSAGWCEFARQNSLKAGDVCTFEMIDTREVVIKVSISRV